MINWDDLHRSVAGSSGGTVVMMLSLNLIILAFFILLNAISRPVENKMSAALYSVQSGFDHRAPGDDMGSDQAALDGPVWIPRVAEAVRGELANLLPGLAEEGLRVAVDEIRVTLPAADAWDGEALKTPAATLLANLAALRKPDSVDVAMEVVVRGGTAAVRSGRVAALLAAVEEVPVGWLATGNGELEIRLVPFGPGLPDFARKAGRVIRAQGAAVETLGKGKEAAGAAR